MNRLLPYDPIVYGYVLRGYADGLLWIEIAVILLLSIGLTCQRRVTGAGVIAPLVLIAAWVGLAWGYFWPHYQPLNWAGFYFGWIALSQAVLLTLWALRSQPLETVRPPKVAYIAFGLALFCGPATRALSDVEAPIAQSVGLTPLATIVVTVAVLLLTNRRTPVWLLPLPFLMLIWEHIRAWVFWLPQDAVLILVSLGCFLAIIWRSNER